jgi:methyl-accepting chemotaxis protein
MKLRGKFILLFTAFALIPVIIAGSIVYFKISSTSMSNAMSTVVNEQKFAMQSIENIIMMTENVGNQTSYDRQVIEFLQKKSQGTSTAEEGKLLDSKLSTMVSGYDVYENILLLDQNGICVADGDYAKSKTGQNMSSLKAFKLANSSGVEYISQIEKSQYSGNPILNIAFPIKVQNTILGTLVQVIDMKKLSTKYIGNIHLVNDGILYVMESDGTTIMHPDDKEIFTTNIAKTEGGKQILKNKKGQNEYFYKQNMMAVYKTDNRLGWIFTAAFPMSKLNEVRNSLIQTFLLLGAAALVLSIILSSIIGAKLSKQITHVAKEMDKVAEGDFTVVFNNIGKDEIAHMSNKISITLEKIRNSILGVVEGSKDIGEMAATLSSTSQEMSASTNEVANAIQDVAKGASSQAEELMNVVNVVSEFSKELETIHEKLELVTKNTSETENKAGYGKNQLDLLMDSIVQIKDSFSIVHSKVDGLATTISKIGNITDVINGISRETDLLALNAAIEAARAGEAGRGFAVVADEVRKLSEESRKSSEEIIGLVQVITSEMKDVTTTSIAMDSLFENQVGTVENTITSFGEIIEAVTSTTPLIKDTYNSVEKANDSKGIMLTKVEAVSAVAEEVSASSQQISASSEQMLAGAEEVSRFASDLSESASKLVEKVNVFKI